MSENVKMYSSEDMTFEKMRKQHLALVDFWAPWCGPCKMLAPIFEDLAAAFDNVTFAKVNIDENMEMAMGLGISSIPTMILFKDGVAVERMVGLQGRDAIAGMLSKHL